MVFLYWLLVILMVVGVVGAVVPGIPGSSLIVIGVLVWGAIKGFATVDWALGVSITVLVLSIGIDLLATYWGVKRAGASQWGLNGAIAGFTLGFLLGFLPISLPIGGPLLIIITPMLGAFIGEYLYRRELERIARINQAFQAGVGIVVGSIIGRLIQGVLAFAALIVFLWQTVPLVWSGQV
jgi:uncharacterized protein